MPANACDSYREKNAGKMTPPRTERRNETRAKQKNMEYNLKRAHQKNTPPIFISGPFFRVEKNDSFNSFGPIRRFVIDLLLDAFIQLDEFLQTRRNTYKSIALTPLKPRAGF